MRYNLYSAQCGHGTGVLGNQENIEKGGVGERGFVFVPCGAEYVERPREIEYLYPVEYQYAYGEFLNCIPLMGN